VPVDDVLDAAGAAWSAHRIATRVARPLPDPPEQRDGRSIAIWY
jgi:predicted RNase H-like nuclease